MSVQSGGEMPRSSISSEPSASLSASPSEHNGRSINSLNGHMDLKGAEPGDEVQNAVYAGEGGVGHGQGRDFDAEQYEDRHQRRQRPRNSGGFLLQDSVPLRSPNNTSKISTRVSNVAKGKRRAEDGELVVPKRAIGRRLVKSTESSPLSSEVIAGQNGIEEKSARDSHREAQEQQHTENRPSISPRSSDDRETPGLWKRAPSQGIDTAQIVNLALSLSESRRRNVSGAANLMPNDVIRGMRKPAGAINGTGGGSLRQHLYDQRHASRNISSRSSGQPSRTAEGSSRLQSKQSSRQSWGLESYEKSFEEEIEFNPSDATIARAEKARVALELGYEYRRLLRYLPSLRPKTVSKYKSNENASVLDLQNLGREYNPLQYIRNRKVRFREKKPLNPEADGWKDVDRVRAWVDSIKGEREAKSPRPDDLLLLPPFEAVADQPTVIEDTDSPDATQSNSISVARPVRPKLDWTFAASDLLADVYWLHQDRNLERIEDRSWRKITGGPILHETKHPKTSKETVMSPDSGKLVNITGSETSPKQERDTALNGKFEPYGRGRRSKSRHKSMSPADSEDESHLRKRRWPKKLLRSRSSSSNGQSDASKSTSQQGIGRNRKGLDNIALEKQLMDMISDGTEENKSAPKSSNGQIRESNASSNVFSIGKENVNTNDQQPDGRPSTRQEPAARDPVGPIDHSPDTERRDRRLSSEDLHTAPTSPAIPGLAPSIAVDLSPPESPPSRSHPAASPPKRPFASRLGSFRRDRSRSTGIRSKSEIDNSKDQALSGAISRQVTHESDSRRSLIKDRSNGDTNGLLAPSKTNSFSSTSSHFQNSKPGKRFKDGHHPDNRRRGFFKGGRIAEIVGNEVSKVGDILWRKDGNHNAYQPDSPDASIFNSDESDAFHDEDHGASAIESNPSDSLSRVTTNTSGLIMKTSNAASERQKYHMTNLPTFRSQTADSDPSLAATSTPANEDHIARQQRMMKERGKSFKFERLAPPRIDMRSVSPSPSPAPSRSQSRNPASIQSRDSSGSRSTRGVRDADQRLNDMLGTPGRVGTGKVAPTGLAAFASSAKRPRNRGRPDIKRQWSISDRGISAVRGTITKRDIARVRALLLSSGIKAHEIVRRNDEVPAEPSALLQELQDIIHGPTPLIPVSQQFAFAARMLVTDIENTHHQLREGAERFSTDVVDQLHHQIKTIDDKVNYQLTPLVRSAADDADAFSTELTTTHTLAVRQLNNNIDLILRRRRRRLRWITRGVWAMLEWAVLGIMWAVWFVVVVVRIVRGTVRGLVSTVRWLLFL